MFDLPRQRQMPALAHDQHRQFQRLLVVQARIDGRLVGAYQIGFKQVARAATAELQQTLRDRQEQVSALRADLGFYSRLTGNGVKREGLAVQAISLARSAEARVYDFTITVTQNLKAGQLASGHVRLSVTGIQAGKLVTLAWAALAPNQDAEGLAFEFKYFQQLKGALMLPAGFMPNRIRAEADAGGDMGRAEQDFAWSEALTIPEIADVHK